MSSEAVAVLDMPSEPAAKARRGRRPAEQKQQSDVQVLFYLGEGSQDSRDLVLGERFESEGLAMVEALKRDVPFYRVEVWKSRAVVKDGSVEIKKEPVTAELADPRADGFRKTNR
jgi:hypothetical protein